MLYWICLILVLAPLLLESLRLHRGRKKLPIRIHIHGTRGKSTTTRALAAMLRAKGMRVLAKTTGDRPEYILPDGAMVPIRRIGPARIREHVGILQKGVAMGVDAVVVEGMALQPETVYLSEKILQATHAVIANTRPDHAETMGAGRKGVQQTLRHMIPWAGALFTAEEEGAGFLKDQAAEKGAACTVVNAAATRQAPALASAVVNAALREIGQPPGPGAISCPAVFPVSETNILGLPVSIIDLLSVNDVVSCQLMLDPYPLRTDFVTVALLATRADRPLRTRCFMDWVRKEPRFDAAALMGGHAGYARLRGFSDGSGIRYLPVRPNLCPKHLLAVMGNEARRQNKNGLTVIALGNAHGYGEKWRTTFQNPKDFSPRPAPSAGG